MSVTFTVHDGEASDDFFHFEALGMGSSDDLVHLVAPDSDDFFHLRALEGVDTNDWA
jgi:hypothetical protein